MLWALLLITAAPASSALELVVETRSDSGSVRCALFDENSKWLEEALADVNAPIHNSTASCRFDGVAPGTYAIVAFHDENGNKKIDIGFLGIPNEGYAASNNAHRVLGKPSFDGSSFKYSGGRVRLRAKMSYLSL